jgi:hypothetical protein
MLEDLKGWGAPQAEIDRWQSELQQGETGDVIVLPLDCAAVMDLFFAVETQWQVLIAGTRAVWLGLHYPGVDVAFNRLQLSPTPEEFALLQLMEREVTAAKAEQR